MRSWTTTPAGSRPPRHSRTPRPPPPRSGLRSQRRARSACAGASAAGNVRGYASPAARSEAPSAAGSRTRRSVSGVQPSSVRPAASRATRSGRFSRPGAVDHALGRDPLGRLARAPPSRRAPPRSRRIDTLGHSACRSRSPKRSSATTSCPSRTRELRQHARADRDEQDHSRPSSSAANSTAVTRSAVVPGLSALPSAGARRRTPRGPPAPRRRGRRRRPARAPRRPTRCSAARRPRLRAIERVRDRREQLQEQLDRGVARREPVVERAGERRQPELERHGVARRVLGGDRVAVGGGGHRLAQRHGGRGAHVVLDGLVEAAGPGRADRRVRGARVVQRERAQHLRQRARAAARRAAPRGRAAPAAARCRGSCSRRRRAASRAPRRAPSRRRPAPPPARAPAPARSRCAACPRRRCPRSRGGA